MRPSTTPEAFCTPAEDSLDVPTFFSNLLDTFLDIFLTPSGHLLDTFWTVWTSLDAPQTLFRRAARKLMHDKQHTAEKQHDSSDVLRMPVTRGVLYHRGRADLPAEKGRPRHVLVEFL